ncbi:lysozyme inhibitor LprI family protein [Luteibacter sp. RCC_6_2]|jgi:uncharacterized protein YecT (DUF1311 family)|uniref:lysozyme inhibitor LprI family protein n=1 Tax=Luteibacter sp. RCC_6_2 TaxID=3239223 RepID=UPI003523E395
MTKTHRLLTIACLLLAGNAYAALPAPDTQGDAQDVINGVAVVPGVERLSYVSPKYYGIRPSYSACIAKSQGRVVDQGDCADSEFKFQDERLNKAYKAVMATLSASGSKEAVAQAQAAQRAWLAYFDKDCAVRAGRFGSSAAPSTESICRMESTAIRAQQLEDWQGSLAARHKD